jgi:hypothetical protein
LIIQAKAYPPQARPEKRAGKNKVYPPVLRLLIFAHKESVGSHELASERKTENGQKSNFTGSARWRSLNP